MKNIKVNDLGIDTSNVKIVIEKEEIEGYENQALDFFEEIFNYAYEEMIVTDLSTVSDFVTLLIDEANLKVVNLDQNSLDNYVINKINSVYNLDLTSTNVKIVDILKRLV